MWFFHWVSTKEDRPGICFLPTGWLKIGDPSSWYEPDTIQSVLLCEILSCLPREKRWWGWKVESPEYCRQSNGLQQTLGLGPQQWTQKSWHYQFSGKTIKSTSPANEVINYEEIKQEKLTENGVPQGPWDGKISLEVRPKEQPGVS